MGSSAPAPSHFLRLAPETRVRIYNYYFSEAIVRLTRPQNGGRALVFAQTRVGLILACRELYIESRPLYAASLKLILKNTRLLHLHSTLTFSPLRHLQCVELVDRSDLSLDTTFLPSLKTLMLSMHPPKELMRPTSKEEAESILEGAQDAALKERRRVLLSLSREGGRRWVEDLILSPIRTFQIIHIVRRSFAWINRFSSPAALIRYRGIILALEYDVDTDEIIQRAVSDPRTQTIRIWKAGKDELYHLCKDGTPGRLLRDNMANQDKESLERRT